LAGLLLLRAVTGRWHNLPVVAVVLVVLVYVALVGDLVVAWLDARRAAAAVKEAGRGVASGQLTLELGWG
jgi:hypothetical protein